MHRDTEHDARRAEVPKSLATKKKWCRFSNSQLYWAQRQGRGVSERVSDETAQTAEIRKEMNELWI